MKKKIIILGAGLSGIYLSHCLKKHGFTVKILEAKNRIGGRIFTKNTVNINVELGATWLWKYNPELMKLCKELKVELFEQNMEGDALFESARTSLPQRFQVPKNQETSFRVIGGTLNILNKLKENISDKEIELNQKAVEIKKLNNKVQVITETSEFLCDLVISTIPPQLLVNSVQFSPNLDETLIKIANNTHTWMKDSIKFSLVYKSPFWRFLGLSGVGFSNIGPFTEIYDHSDFENQHFALMGFLRNDLANIPKVHREQKIKEQLFNFFGKEGENYISYQEKIWSKDKYLSFNNNVFISPHYNNGHPIYKTNFFSEKLIIAGSETSSKFGGYMEGAIHRGNEVIKELKNKYTM